MKIVDLAASDLVVWPQTRCRFRSSSRHASRREAIRREEFPAREHSPLPLTRRFVSIPRLRVEHDLTLWLRRLREICASVTLSPCRRPERRSSSITAKHDLLKRAIVTRDRKELAVDSLRPSPIARWDSCRQCPTRPSPGHGCACSAPTIQEEPLWMTLRIEAGAVESRR